MPWNWVDSAPEGDLVIDPTTNAATSEDVRLYDAGNYGSDTRLAVGKFQNTGNLKTRTLISFNLTGIPSNAIVLNAQMRLKYYEVIGSGGWVDRWVQAHQMLASWNEAQADSLKRLTGVNWGAPRGKIGGTNPDANGQFESTLFFWQSEQQTELPKWKSWDLTALTQKWLNGTATNYGVILWATNEDVASYTMRFHSSEASNSSDRPYLEVVYSTEAATSTVYFLKDHLGSIRATVLDSAGAPVIGYDDYDAWGYPLALRTKAIPNAYLQGASKNKFTGREWDDDYGMNWWSFLWRPYDPQIARWFIVDPLAQKYPSWSPYHYALDNPIRFYDIDGRDIKNATKRNVVVVGDIKNSDEIAYAVLGEGDRTEGLKGDFDFYRFADEDEENATWYKVSQSDWIDVDVTETGEPKITNLLGKLLAKLPKIHVRKATPEEAELAETLKKRVEKKKEQEAERKQEEERRKQEEERKKREEEEKKQEERKKENERQ